MAWMPLSPVPLTRASRGLSQRERLGGSPCGVGREFFSLSPWERAGVRGTHGLDALVASPPHPRFARPLPEGEAWWLAVRRRPGIFLPLPLGEGGGEGDAWLGCPCRQSPSPALRAASPRGRGLVARRAASAGNFSPSPSGRGRG